jgi:hypothetical protein
LQAERASDSPCPILKVYPAFQLAGERRDPFAAMKNGVEAVARFDGKVSGLLNGYRRGEGAETGRPQQP